MKLAENVFNNPEMIPTRNGFGEALLELGEENKNVVVLTGDLTESVRAHKFGEKYPNRLFRMGIAEQNMMSVAAGLSAVGKIPFVATFSIFATGRAWEQLRTSVCYNEFNVKIAASHGGITVGEDGASHHATEDIGIARVIPNIKVIIPVDSIEAKKATIEAARIYGPMLLRLSRDKFPVITTNETPFEIGKANVIRFGDDVTVFASGVMVYESLLAAKTLEKEGIDVRVVNVHTVKPIDEKAIITAAKETGVVVTAEEHQHIGGLGSAVAEVLIENYPVPMKRVGIRDVFGESGKPRELMEKYRITSKDIAKAVKEVLKKKFAYN
ncbi:MAG: transketolase family protein [Candidatus Aenigmarchaeota archaeon]|nr:transketolase family protein [Candidatus Aenigmarchaeota archaeon]